MSTIVIPYYAIISFKFPDTVTVNEEFPFGPMPYEGEIVGWSGGIANLGTGAGTSTDFQLINESRTPDLNYFSIVPTFEVDSATKVLEGGQLIDSPTFSAGETLKGKITAVSTSPEDAVVSIVIKLRKPVTV